MSDDLKKKIFEYLHKTLRISGIYLADEASEIKKAIEALDAPSAVAPVEASTPQKAPVEAAEVL